MFALIRITAITFLLSMGLAAQAHADRYHSNVSAEATFRVRDDGYRYTQQPSYVREEYYRPARPYYHRPYHRHHDHCGHYISYRERAYPRTSYYAREVYYPRPSYRREYVNERYVYDGFGLDSVTIHLH